MAGPLKATQSANPLGKGKVWLIREFWGITFEKDFSGEPSGGQ
jgi:hypothetical protein